MQTPPPRPTRRCLPLLLVLAEVLAAVLPASPSHAEPPPPSLNGIAHVAIRVKDLDASRAFYEKLGFVQAFALSRPDGGVYEAFIKINDRQFVELYSPSGTDTRIGFLHLCFEGADLNALHDVYVAHGLTPISVRKAGAGNLLFTLAGPAQPTSPGTIPQNIEYTQYLPNSKHSNDFGQHLGPGRIADRITAVTLAMVDPIAARSFYTDKLGFLPSPTDPNLLLLPGSSGQGVEIAPASLGSIARITLSTSDFKKTVTTLKRAHIQATSPDGVLTIADPDGNQLLLQKHELTPASAAP